MDRFLLTFIPIFVATDPIGLIPIYLSLSEGLEKKIKERIIRQSLLSATLIALAFIAVGKMIFLILGISVADFQIAGGIVLLILAVMDIVGGLGFPHPSRLPTMGIVPLAVPLITGPAVLTTIVMFADIYGPLITLFSFLINLLIVGLVLHLADKLIAILGEAGTRGISKIVSLLLAAFAITMIRKGIKTILLT